MVCYLALIDTLNIVSLIRDKDPFLNELTAKNIAKELLDEMELKVGHDKERIYEKLLEKKHGIRTLDRKIMEHLKKRKEKKKKTKLVVKNKKEFTSKDKNETEQLSTGDAEYE